MSSRPCWSTTSATVRRQSSGDPMSPRCTVDRLSGKSSVMVRQKVSAASWLPLYPAATSAPCAARLRQIAAPIPRVPPVTKATRPTSFSPTRPVRACVAVTSAPSDVRVLELRGAGAGRRRLLGPWVPRASCRAGCASIRARRSCCAGASAEVVHLLPRPRSRAGPARAGTSPQVVHLLQPVHRRRDPLVASLQLQREVQRVVPRLVQVAAVEPQRLLPGGLPHVALLALPRAGVLDGVRAQSPDLADGVGDVLADEVGGPAVHRALTG